MANKIIKCIFISFLAVFLMSYNVNALDLTEEVVIRNVYRNPYWRDNNSGSVFANGSHGYGNNVDFSGSSYITLKSSGNNNITADVGDYFIINGTVIAYANDPGYLNQSTFFGLSTSDVDCPIIDFDVDEVQVDLNNASQHRSSRYTFTATCRVYTAVSTGPSINLYLATAGPQAGSILYYVQMNAMVQAYADTSVNNIASRLSTISNYLQNIYSNNEDILNVLNDLSDNLGAQGEAAQKELDSTENIENQSEPTQDTGDNAASTNLIGNISSVITQIGNIPASSSCNIPANWGNLNLGNLNLCTGKENMPWVVNFGAQVFQFVFVIGTGIILVKQVLALYDWSRK